ncbi:MAG: prepilin-type N-terminal cleavage/methylation domain-containing protein [Deltaproteobacteria bacterium]|nr:MAG: prepilin-type N-terminal cleavage/methylation domain-containing protein [Deltaproteobacteria bacterium]
MKNEKGFTLIELLVAMLVAGIVMAGVYSAYYSQQKSFVVQDELAEMQQNLRAAMFFMAKEIRMAGCNPTGSANAGIEDDSTANTIHFTMDLRGKDPNSVADGDTGDPGENITYTLADLNGDGIMEIVRDTGSGQEMVAENIDALHFDYLKEDGTTTTDRLLMRSVQITIVARTGRGDLGYVDNETYYDLQDPKNAIFGPAGDNFRRRRLATNIKCRNLGLL